MKWGVLYQTDYTPFSNLLFYSLSDVPCCEVVMIGPCLPSWWHNIGTMDNTEWRLSDEAALGTLNKKRSAYHSIALILPKLHVNKLYTKGITQSQEIVIFPRKNKIPTNCSKWSETWKNSIKFVSLLWPPPQT